MADPPDPNAGGILGLLGKFGSNPAALYQGALSDPETQYQMANRGLLAAAGSFADSAMPTRMPTPFGAVLGHAAAAMGTSGDAVMGARLQEAQSEQARAASQLLQGKVGLMKMLPDVANAYQTADGGGGGGVPSAPAPGATAGGTTGGRPTGPIDPAMVTSTALNQNVDPLLAHTTMDIESSYGTNTGNEKSPSNTGAFQRAPADGPGGQNDTYENQVNLGVQDLAREKADLAARLGREPTNAEVYLAHQQGPDGAAKLINNPDTPAGKLVRPVNISNNGGKQFLDQPASAFVQHWQQVYAQREAKFAHLAAPSGGGAPGPGATQTTAAPPGLLNLGDPNSATGRMNAPIPGVVGNAAPSGGMPGPQAGSTVNVGASTLPPGAASAPLPPPLPPGGPPPPAPAGPNLMPGGALATPPALGGLLGPDAAGMANLRNIPPPPAPPPAPPPGPLVQTPPPGPSIPPIAAPPPPAAPPSAAVAPPPIAGVQGAPSPAKIAAAKKYEMYLNALGLPVPEDVKINAAWNEETAKAVRDAQIKLHTTPFRPYGAVLNPDGSWTVAPGPPIKTGGPPIPPGQPGAGQPTEQLIRPSVTPGVPSTSENIGPTGASPLETKAQEQQAPYVIPVPGNPTGKIGSVPQGIDPTKPIPSPANALPGRTFQTTIPELDKQPPTTDIPTYGKAQEIWLKDGSELSNAGVTAQSAEANLTAIARAYQMVQSGPLAMKSAEFTGLLAALGLKPPESTAGLAALQTALHNNYKQTLSTLKAANSKFTGNEFKINSDAGEAAGNQPEANLTLLSQDIGQVRQIQGLASDWNAAQRMVGSNGAHWVNLDAFRTAWRETNPLQPMIDQARAQFPLMGTSGFVPPGVPVGSTRTGRTAGGKPVWQAPDGSFHTGN
jgi:hypothetical protein